MMSDSSTRPEQAHAQVPAPGNIDPRIGSVLADRYRIHSLIGEGGMGKVYAGEHVLMRKRVAVKVLHKELTVLPDVVRRFEREAMAAATIAHPNVAAATDFGHLPDDSIFLVLEYVQGISLRSEIATGSFPVIRAIHIARQIASALASAEARGIVHRDLKPENVMLVEMAGDPDFVKVLDFGIAKVPIHESAAVGAGQPGQIITKIGTIFGTPEYMAPEQALGETADGRADQYSLGVVLFEMLTGHRPFGGGSQVGILGQQLKWAPPLLSEFAPHLDAPPAVDELLQRMLAAERDRRFSCSNELVEVLEALQLSLQPTQIIRGSRPDASLGLGSLGDAPASVRGAKSELAAWPSPPSERRSLRPPEHSAEDLRRPGNSQLSFRRRMSLAIASGLLLGAIGVLLSRNFLSLGRAHPLPDELAQARALGVASLDALARRFPKDSQVVVEKAKALFAAGQFANSVAAAASALAIDPKAADNADIATLLWKTVQKRETTEAAFHLLEGPMRESGTDILYDLANAEGLRSDVHSRALEHFTSGRYRAHSRPALRVLLALKAATSCEERQRYIEQSLTLGDERYLPLLTALKERVGCGADGQSDCNPCLRSTDLIERAMEAIQRRTSP